MIYFKTNDGDTHMVDHANNHFISKKGLNGIFRCVNPDKDSEDKIGSTIPSESERTYFKGFQVTGHVPYSVDVDEDGNKKYTWYPEHQTFIED